MKSNKNILYLLIKKCLEHNLHFNSFYAYTGRYIVTAHDRKLAGKKPELNEMRDTLDYQFAIDNWHRAGIIILAVDDDPYGAINLALDYLDKLQK